MVMSKKPLEKSASENDLISFGCVKEHAMKGESDGVKTNMLGWSKDGFIYGNQLIKISGSFASIETVGDCHE